MLLSSECRKTLADCISENFYFDISMEYISVMKFFKPLNDLNEDFPDLAFLEKLFLFLFLCDSVAKVTVIGEFHDDAKNEKNPYQRDFVCSSTKAYL